jgi:hypothetical protein
VAEARGTAAQQPAAAAATAAMPLNAAPPAVEEPAGASSAPPAQSLSYPERWRQWAAERDEALRRFLADVTAQLQASDAARAQSSSGLQNELAAMRGKLQALTKGEGGKPRLQETLAAAWADLQWRLSFAPCSCRLPAAAAHVQHRGAAGGGAAGDHAGG